MEACHVELETRAQERPLTAEEEDANVDELFALDLRHDSQDRVVKGIQLGHDLPRADKDAGCLQAIFDQEFEIGVALPKVPGSQRAPPGRASRREWRCPRPGRGRRL